MEDNIVRHANMIKEKHFSNWKAEEQRKAIQDYTKLGCIVAVAIMEGKYVLNPREMKKFSVRRILL